MMVKSFVVSLLLFAVYTWFTVTHPTAFGKGQHQWQDNVIRAQNYLYTSNVPEHVIIGSSMACRINDALLPSSFFKLTFGGQGIFDGLAVISRHQQLPKTVFVEMNMIEREPNTDFAGTLFAPGLLAFRKYCLPLQDCYQPANLLSGNFCQIMSRLVYQPIASQFFNRVLRILFPLHVGASVKEGVGSRMSVDQQKRYAMLADSILIKKQLTVLRQQILVLAQKGTQFVFFEMPMSQALEYSVKQQQIRQLFKQYFPEHQYRYLQKPDYGNFVTTDGVHLNAESANLYSNFFFNGSKE